MAAYRSFYEPDPIDGIGAIDEMQPEAAYAGPAAVEQPYIPQTFYQAPYLQQPIFGSPMLPSAAEPQPEPWMVPGAMISSGPLANPIQTSDPIQSAIQQSLASLGLDPGLAARREDYSQVGEAPPTQFSPLPYAPPPTDFTPAATSYDQSEPYMVPRYSPSTVTEPDTIYVAPQFDAPNAGQVSLDQPVTPLGAPPVAAPQYVPPAVDIMAERARLEQAAAAAAAARAAAEQSMGYAPAPAGPAPIVNYDYSSNGTGAYGQEARGFAEGGRVRVMLRGIYPDENAYAEGGLVEAANQVRGAGRYGDDYLVHLQPEEFAELRGMYGDPTINPDTGLPEFFLGIKLKKIGKFLKAAVRVGATIAGAAVGGPAGAALGAGLSTKLTGGSWKQALGSAAMAGIGTYVSAPSGGLFGNNTPLSNTLSTTKVGQALGAKPFTAPVSSVPTISSAAHSGSPLAGQMAQGAAMQGATSTALPPSFLSTATSALTQPKNLALIGGIGALSAATSPSGSGGGQSYRGVSDDYTLSISPYQRGPVFMPADPFSYGRTGGEMPFFSNINPMPEITKVPVAQQAPVRKAMGGAISGIGGGQDDKIPALLSDGEYVIDAETVAALGDGSNDAGAAKLDKFRENVRRHKRRASAKSIPPKAKAPEAYMGAR